MKCTLQNEELFSQTYKSSNAPYLFLSSYLVKRRRSLKYQKKKKHSSTPLNHLHLKQSVLFLFRLTCRVFFAAMLLQPLLPVPFLPLTLITFFLLYMLSSRLFLTTHLICKVHLWFLSSPVLEAYHDFHFTPIPTTADSISAEPAIFYSGLPNGLSLISWC